MTYVLDASALLVLFQREPGSDDVAAMLDGAVISAVNWSEVLQKSIAGGAETGQLRDGVMALGLSILPFDAEAAERTAELWPSTRDRGLSLADRACIALAAQLDGTAVTADRAWADAAAGVRVRLLR